MRAFGHVLRVTVAGFPAGRLSPSDPLVNAFEIERMRVQFDVKKNLGKHPNKCVIKITNLSADTRSRLDSKPLRVILQAGYRDSMKLLFDGDLVRVSPPTQESRTDVVTELHVGDGHRGFSTSRLNQNYGARVTLRRVVQDAARSLGLAVPSDVLRPGPFDQTLADFSCSSLTHEALSTALSQFGFGWSSQNRQLVILRDDQVRAGSDVVVNQASGLIKSPRRKDSDGKEGKGSKSEISFDHLLFPDLVPGATVKVESEFLNQRVKIEDSNSKGDTHSSSEWTTSVKGKPL